jgi:hypothetical protein
MYLQEQVGLSSQKNKKKTQEMETFAVRGSASQTLVTRQ